MHGWMEGGKDRGATDNGWINVELDEGKERNSVRRRKGRSESWGVGRLSVEMSGPCFLLSRD